MTYIYLLLVRSISFESPDLLNISTASTPVRNLQTKNTKHTMHNAQCNGLEETYESVIITYSHHVIKKSYTIKYIISFKIMSVVISVLKYFGMMY